MIKFIIKPFIIEVIEIIWPRSQSIISHRNNVLSTISRSLIKLSASIIHFSLSISVIHFFVYIISLLLSLLFLLFFSFHIISYVNISDTLLCFFVLFSVCRLFQFSLLISIFTFDISLLSHFISSFSIFLLSLFFFCSDIDRKRIQLHASFLRASLSFSLIERSTAFQSTKIIIDNRNIEFKLHASFSEDFFKFITDRTFNFFRSNRFYKYFKNFLLSFLKLFFL